MHNREDDHELKRSIDKINNDNSTNNDLKDQQSDRSEKKPWLRQKNNWKYFFESYKHYTEHN